MKKTILILILTLAATLAVNAQEKQKVYQGFSGGMMLHSGYLSGINPNAPVSPQGLSNGIGGALRVNLFKHIRVGFDGYVSTLNSTHSDASTQLADGSYIRTGLGGLLVDWCWRTERWWPYVGVGVGGGSMKGLYILKGDQNDWQPEPLALFNKQSFFYVSPFIGTDYCLTPRMHLTLRADWLLALHDGELLRPTGPRLFVGFMFCH